VVPNERGNPVRLQVATDPHSPPKFRVNGVVQNMPEFRGQYRLQGGPADGQENACRVW
jgi:predicted metalloendopeptidase